GNYRVMVRQVGVDFPERINRKSLVGKNVIDPQGRRQAGKSAAYAAALLQKSVLQLSLDGKIGVGGRRIVKVAANNYGVRAFLDKARYNIGLPGPPYIGVPHFLHYIAGGHQPRIFLLLYLLYVQVV